MSKKRVARSSPVFLSWMHRRARLPAEGFIMLEFLAALALVSVLVVTLAASVERATAGAREARNRLAEVSTPVTENQDLDPWSWGPQLLEGRWGAGPVLYLQTPLLSEPSAEDGLHESYVGVWIDGWLVTEIAVGCAESETMRLDSLLWTGCEGREVVARLRIAEQGWGPPWRSVVPFAVENRVSQDSTHFFYGVGGRVAVHPTSLGTLLPEVTLAGARVAATSQGPPALFDCEVQGLWEISLDGRRQSFWSDAGRELDVYY